MKPLGMVLEWFLDGFVGFWHGFEKFGDGFGKGLEGGARLI